jgi:hypothetical protein
MQELVRRTAPEAARLRRQRDQQQLPESGEAE